MPELARFYGIVVQVYYGDHLPPHFHVQYSGHSAKIDIESLALIEGVFVEVMRTSLVVHA